MAAVWALVPALAVGCAVLEDDQASTEGGANSEGSAPGATGPPPAGGDSPRPGQGDPPAATLPPPVAPDPDGPVGSYARLLLDPAAQLQVAVLTQPGAEPDAATSGGLRSTLAEVTGKAATVLEPQTVSGGPNWTGEQIRRVGSAAGPPGSAGVAVVKLLFLRGEFSERPSALGVAVSASVAAVFTDQVEATAGLLGSRRRHELAVTIHELGHLLGLVDLVLDTGREDPEHPGHSRNRESVMFWAVESSLVGDVLTGGPPTEFDDADRADLDRIRADS